jgi:hypothetical protein
MYDDLDGCWKASILFGDNLDGNKPKKYAIGETNYARRTYQQIASRFRIPTNHTSLNHPQPEGNTGRTQMCYST